MQLYLALSTDTLQYTDYADYPDGIPYPAPEGFQWVEGELPTGAIPYIEKSLAEKMQDVFKTLPVDLQAQFAPLKAAVSLELQQGNSDVALAIITNTTPPVGYEALKDQLITLLTGG